MDSDTYTYTMVWPIVDEDMTMDELTAQALPELFTALAVEDVVLLEPAEWEVMDSVKWPHPNGSVDGLILVARARGARAFQLYKEQEIV